MKYIFTIIVFITFFNPTFAQTCNGTLGNPIVNFDFGQGNASQYWYGPLSTYAPGLYTNTIFYDNGMVGENSSGLLQNADIIGPTWANANDHTGNSYGLFLAINMPNTIGDTVVEYVINNLCPNTTLNYSVWLLNLVSITHPLFVNNSPLLQYPNVTMRILDDSDNLLGETITGDVPVDDNWHQYQVMFENGNNTTIKIQIINNTAGSEYGNDMGMDDITISPCVPITEISSDTTLCHAAAINIQGQITPGVYTTPYLQWQSSTNTGTTWNNIGGLTTSTTLPYSFTTNNAPAQYWFRYIVSPSDTGINTSCSANSGIVTVSIDSIETNFLNQPGIACTTTPVSLISNSQFAEHYLWSTGDTTTTITASPPGTFWLQITSLYGCTAIDSVSIIAVNFPEISLSPDSVLCEGMSYVISATENDSVSYLWSTGSNSSSITVTQSGNYWVQLEYQDCQEQDTVSVSFNEVPLVNLGNDTTICPGATLYLTNSPNYAQASYSWNTGSNDTAISIQEAGYYWLQISNYPNCMATDTIHVAVVALPAINLPSDTALCKGIAYTISAVSNDSVSYLWSTGSNDPSITVMESGNYWLQVGYQNCYEYDTTSVTFSEMPVADIGSDTAICNGTSVRLSNSITYPQASYNWSTGSNDTAIAIQDSGYYWLQITNYPNCVDADTIFVSVINCDCSLYIPSAFSPNGDGLNDIFMPKGIEACPVKAYDFSIYNRWGQKVFHTNNPNAGWEGVYNNKSADIGSYEYYVRYNNASDNKLKIYKGDLTLLR